MDITQNRRLAGASVLPYSCDPSHNNIYFLLGAERRMPRWVDSNKWSDFGGAPKHDETAADCAGREFHEETCAAVKWDEGEGDENIHFVRQSSLPVINDLKSGNFSFKMITLIDDDRYYATYIKQVPFDGSIHRRTNTLLSSLGRIRMDVRQSGSHEMNNYEKSTVLEHPAVRLNTDDECIHVSKDYLEKQSVQWVSIPQLEESLKNDNTRNPYVLRDSFRGRVQNILQQFSSSSRLDYEKLSATEVSKYFPNGTPNLAKSNKINPIHRESVRVELDKTPNQECNIFGQSPSPESRPEQQMFTINQ